MLHPVLNRRQDVGGAPSITTWMSCRWRAKSHYRLRSPKNGVWGRKPPAAWGLSGGVGGSTPPDKRVLRKMTLFIKNEMGVGVGGSTPPDKRVLRKMTLLKNEAK